MTNAEPDPVTLGDKYDLAKGRAYLNGTQALVRLALVQAARDRAAGLDTAGFVSGYRGSPLGGVDMAFELAARETKAAQIHFVPGVNEDLAATSVLGTQQINLLEKARKEGVFAMWYGKGPGVDRSGDAFRHGNLAGTSSSGGVLLLAGDDHVCKSSTTSHQSEFALVDAMIPILSPSSLSEIISFGLHGWAMSRYSGCWSAMKLVGDLVDSSGSVAFSGEARLFTPPDDFLMPPGGVSIRWPDTPQEQERRLHNWKLPAASAFAQANSLDFQTMGPAKGRLGIVAAGKAYADTRQALIDLGIDDDAAHRLGLGLFKVGLVWPLGPQDIGRFVAGFDQVLVVEEKRSLVEAQLKELLYNLPADARPRVYGKTGASGEPLLPAHDDLGAERIARAILAQTSHWPEIADLLKPIVRDGGDAAMPPSPVERTPYFCSGCPHSTSTRLPEGSRALSGIGCHWMAQSMDRNTATNTHMGGEGANWIGQAPFVDTPHIFQNMGDGTFYHSGYLAIRAAVASGVTMTYKILFNDAVAMTGGQHHDGPLNAVKITQMVLAEGATRVVVVADDPAKYGDARFPEGVTIHHRDELDTVQRQLREVKGVSVLVYDQVCAATKRRRMKRGEIAVVEQRAFINEDVCEGCGDCSVKSNCLSVTPVETALGTKRRIDQTSCNTDLSCIKGFCPSFVTVTGAAPRKAKSAAMPVIENLPVPATASMAGPYNILITGVGGTGVVTIGAILAMAAHIEGKACSTLDMTGLAQKGGEVITHLRLAPKPDQLHAVTVPEGNLDVLIGCDLVTAAGKGAMPGVSRGRTTALLNTHETITKRFITERDYRLPRRALVDQIAQALGRDRVATVDANAVTQQALGDTMGSSLFMVGFAFQQGLLPLGLESIEQAIELNGVAVAMNKAAFALGRKAALGGSRHDVSNAAAGLPRPDWSALLTAYQNAAYARRFEAIVANVADAERRVSGEPGTLTEIAARNLYRLMAYKDEYEVARLYAATDYRERLESAFEPGGKVSILLAPPLLARRDPSTGEPRKLRFGPWVFGLFRFLAAMKGLRGTVLDPFGYSAERRQERALVERYAGTLATVSSGLTAENLDLARELCDVPGEIRGFGPVKERSIAATLPRWSELEGQFASGRPTTVSPDAPAPALERGMA